MTSLNMIHKKFSLVRAIKILFGLGVIIVMLLPVPGLLFVLSHINQRGATPSGPSWDFSLLVDLSLGLALFVDLLCVLVGFYFLISGLKKDKRE